jgi:hypothetical protein
MTAVIVETGAGLSNADSYTSVADATTYHANIGNADAWDAIEDKDAALRKATIFMVRQYRTMWAGVRAKISQALDWPRYDVPMLDGPSGYRSFPNYYDFDVVPNEVKHACAELALKTADGELIIDLERATASESVGSISVTYFDAGQQQKRFTAIDKTLRPLFGGGGGSAVPVRRA